MSRRQHNEKNRQIGDRPGYDVDDFYNFLRHRVTIPRSQHQNDKQALYRQVIDQFLQFNANADYSKYRWVFLLIHSFIDSMLHTSHY